ncbi:MAG: class A beta-lactamase-related serine hydrolase [Chitinophagaceae bacterium]|nr:MAG: class A beta-lactamase-related serine hydrolase [Chitinophagaceae bacterium]
MIHMQQMEKDADSLAKFVQQKADSTLAKSKVPGILVLYNNKDVSGIYSAGYADPATKKTFDNKTFFETGSITKTFTAYVLMSVLRDHKIEDSTAIITYLPKAVQQNSALNHIRFLNLMNHTSGLPRLPQNMELKDNDLQPYADYDSKKLFEYLQTAKPATNGKYEYSNLGAGLAGVLAETISGKSYAALLDQYIFLPFKMVDKNNSLEKSANKSQGYIDDDTKAEYWNMNVLAPAGGLKCNADEMIKYLQNMSKPANKQTAALIDSLTVSTYQLSSVMGIGRGWHYLAQKNKPVIYWHNGGTYGFSTFAAFVKGTGQWVMVVVNMFDKNNTVSDKIGMQIIQKMLD